MKKSRENKNISIYFVSSHKIPFVIIALSSFVMINWLKWSLYSIWDLTIPPFYPEISIQKLASVWDYSTVGGRYFIYLGHWIYHAIVYFLNFIFSVEIANTILFWALYFICGLSMYLFVYETTSLNDDTKQFAATVAALAYMFNPYWIFRVNTLFTTIFILSFLPLLLLVLRKSIMANNKSQSIKYSIKSILIAFLMIPGLSVLPSALATSLFVFIYLLIFAILHRKVHSFIVTITSFLFFSLFTNLWWLGPQFIHKTIQDALIRGGSYVQESLFSLQWWSTYTTYNNIMRGLPYHFESLFSIKTSMSAIFSKNILLYLTPLFIWISYLTPIISFISILSRKISKSSENLIFALVCIIFIPYFASLNFPFGFVNRWLVLNFPLFIMRRPPNYFYIIQFCYSYLFGLGIVAIYDMLKMSRFLAKYKLQKLVSLSIIFSLLFLVLIINAFPLWLGFDNKINLRDETGTIQPVSANVRLPMYVKDLISYLNSLPEDGGVLVLPRQGFLRGYNWTSGYFGLDPYYLSLTRPVLSELIEIYPMYDVYFLLDYLIKYNLTDFSRLLTLVNIKYVVVTEDFLINPASRVSLSPVNNISKIHSYLTHQTEIKFVRRFGPHVLYALNETPKTYYAVNNAISPQFEDDTIFSLQDYLEILEDKIINKINITLGDVSFWYPLNEGNGTYQSIISSNNGDENIRSSNISMKIKSGFFNTVGITHRFTLHQDWSNSDCLIFNFLGENSKERFNVYIYSGDSWNSYINFNIIDNEEGWKRIILPWDNPDLSIGEFNLSDVRVIRIQNSSPNKNVNIKLDQITLASFSPDSQIISTEPSWAGSNAILAKVYNDTLEVTYSHTKERYDRGWSEARIYNDVPFRIFPFGPVFLKVNILTPPNIIVNIFLGDAPPGINTQPLQPIHITDEPEQGNLISTDNSTYLYVISGVYAIDYFTIGMRVIDPEIIGNYTVSVNFSIFPDLDELDLFPTLNLLRTLPEKVVIVQEEFSDLNNNSVLPKLTEEKISPLQSNIHVKNASSPFLLISTNTFDSSWEAEIDGISPKHIKVNAGFNGWFVNQTGNYTINIYYTKQIIAQRFYVVSIISILTLLGLSIIFYIRDQRKKDNFIIGLVGVDGTGKTTHAKWITDYFRLNKIDVKMFHLFSPESSFISRKHKNILVKTVINCIETNNSGIFGALIRLMIRIFGIILDSWITYFKNIFSEQIIIYDRYFSDKMIAAIGLYKNEFGLKFSNYLILLTKMLPKTDITFLLWVSPKVSYLRKKDHDYEEYKIISNFYCKFSQYNDVLIVNTEKDINSVREKIKQIIESKYEKLMMV